MNRRERRDRVARQDREAALRAPDRGETENAAVAQRYPVRLTAASLPLVEGIGRHDAAPFGERTAEAGAGRRALDARVHQRRRPRRAREAPAHRLDPTLLR